MTDTTNKEQDYDKLAQLTSTLPIDERDTRDYERAQFEDLFVDNASYDNASKKVFKWDEQTKLENQGRYPYCASAGICNIINGFNLVEFRDLGQPYENLGFFDFHKRYCEPRNTCSFGRTKQSALAQAKQEGKIEGYVRIPQDKSMGVKIVQTIDSGYLVYITLVNGNRNETHKTKIYSQKVIDPNDTRSIENTRHAVAIVDRVQYNGIVCLKVANSWGEEFGDNGYFYIPLDKVDSLVFEPYAVIDKDDSGTFRRLKMLKALTAVIATAGDYRNSEDTTAKEKNALQLIANAVRYGFDLQPEKRVPKSKLLDLINSL